MNPDTGLPNLSLQDTSLTPTIDVPALDTTPLNTASDIPAATPPAANVNQSGGFNFDQVTNALVNMFDNGVSAYNNVAKTLGTKQIGANTAATPATPATIQALGLQFTQTQLWIIGGGLGLLALMLIIKRR